MRAVSGQSSESQDKRHHQLHRELALPEQHPDDCLLSSATHRVDLSVRVRVQSPIRALSSKKSSILSRIKTSDFQSSTKIEALREEVHKMLQADPSAKAIVFSQFTSMLDLVSFRLEQVLVLSDHACLSVLFGALILVLLHLEEI